MENQINMDNQNTLQVGQNQVNQPVQIPEKPKVNYLVIGLVVLVCFVVFGLGGYYLGKQSSLSVNTPSIVPQPTQQTSPTPSQINNQANSNQSPASIVTANWKTYKFADYPFEFKYPDTLTLKEKPDPNESNFVVGLYNGDVKIMTIRPEQPGVGFENPDVEITTVPLVVDGKQLFINNKAVNKTKLYDKVDKTTTYIVFIGYSDKRDYSIMIPSFFSDNSGNKELSDIYDRVISTIKFVN